MPEIIKVCGITRPADAIAAAGAGATAVGMIFYRRSPRAVRVHEAAMISAVIPPGVAKVGVFVNEEPDQVLAIAEAEMATGIAALREAEEVLAGYPAIDGSMTMIATIGIENGETWGEVEGEWNGQPLTEGYVNLGDPGEACLVVPQVGTLCSSL